MHSVHVRFESAGLLLTSFMQAIILVPGLMADHAREPLLRGIESAISCSCPPHAPRYPKHYPTTSRMRTCPPYSSDFAHAHMAHPTILKVRLMFRVYKSVARCIESSDIMKLPRLSALFFGFFWHWIFFSLEEYLD